MRRVWILGSGKRVQDAAIPAIRRATGFTLAGVLARTAKTITVEGEGRKRTFRAEGVGEGRGDTFKNPVTGEEHLANVELPTGFIWTKGECGQGTFSASSNGVSVGAEKSNWILYDFDWSNA